MIDLTSEQINELFQGTCKFLTKDYVIYKREWLEKNIEMETEIIKNQAEWRKKGIVPFDKEIIDKLNEIGNPGYIMTKEEIEAGLKESNK